MIANETLSIDKLEIIYTCIGQKKEPGNKYMSRCDTQ